MDSPGLNIELFNVISNRLSLKVEWVRAPFPRCLILLQNGEVDLINAVSYQKAREKYGKYPFTEGEIDISKRLKYDTYHAFVNSTDQVQWKKGKFVELGKMPVAIETGASVKNLLNRLNIDVLELPNAEHAFGMLLKKRVSAVITNVNNGYKYAHPSIKRLAEPVQNKAYYLMISNQFYQTHTELAEKIWLGSQSLHISTYQAVEDKYNKATPW
ncbi:transporter substrate-binding domain-containing protein [Paraglaciecola aquimarina]|uniref:Transporter substrate-binding domain-containing protein n=1 Tax=Paraglaciecola algarum TaxID=3050085 RepID=A0ABS9D9N5_9ALTE|nr:transporter substrate-binding domain-containing protein [Paraglaciecola sp. G1-23]MCF2949681.1 transporter substrate-binding domain-containing protein [Paraglaciecola sp. G1-23]